MTRNDWTRAKASELRTQAQTLRRQSSQGSYLRAARKGEAIRRMEAMAERLERMARAGRGPEALDWLPF